MTGESTVSAAATGTAARKGFRLDLNLCTGCGACAVACAIENELDWGTSWRFIETFNPAHEPGLPHYHLSLACNHCADAPCMNHCPALAYHRDDLTGAVLLNPDQCIGCRYCTWACPYDAPRFDAEAGVVSKCTFCHHRQLEGLTPACVGQCPTGALTFGDLDTLTGDAGVAGFPETPAQPSIRFEALRPGALVPAVGSDGPVEAPFGASAVAPGSAPLMGGHRPRARTTLASEGPLVAFTLLAALGAGLMATPPGRALLGLPVFVLLMVLAAAASTLHLGRKTRAWRAVLNVRRSWLSREVVLFSLFGAVGALALAGDPAAAPWLPADAGAAVAAAVPAWAPTAAAFVGFALLFAVDRVYAVTRTRGLAFHSARVLLTGVMVAGLAAGMPWLWGAAAAAKGVSFVGRLARGGVAGGRAVGGIGPGTWALARLGPGLALPVGALLLAQTGPLPDAVLVVSLAFLALGEIVDRCAFYLELGIGSGGVTAGGMDRAKTRL